MAESFGDLDPKIDGREDGHRARAWSSPASTGSRRTSGRPATSARTARSPTSCWPTSRRSWRKANAEKLDPAAARQRRQGAARRGRHRQDHRRGGPLLAHRPVGLRRQPRGLQGRRRRAAPGAARSATPTLVAELDERFAAVEAALGKHRAGDGWKLHTELTKAELKELSRRDQRAGRAGQQGRRGRRRQMSDVRRRPTVARRSGMSDRPRRRLLGARPAPARPASLAARRRRRGADRARRRAATAAAATPRPPRRSPFYGAHQAGIVTPAQDRLHFVAFDVITDDRDRAGRDAAGRGRRPPRRMTAGQDAGAIGAVGGVPEAPPDDTGEALGLPPSRLTLTIGFGPTLFRDADGTDRFGLAGRRPAAAGRPAALPRRRARPGDLRRRPVRPGLRQRPAGRRARHPQPGPASASGVVSVRWSQLGFGRTSSTSHGPGDPAQPVRLQGRHRTTSRPRTTELLRDQLVGRSRATGADWMAGGSYLVTRRIRMLIETWDRTSLGEQEADHRPDQGRAARRWASAGEFDPSRLRRSGRDGEPADRRRRRTSGWPTRPEQRGAGCCAAATTSSTAPTGWAGSTPGCSSSPTSATRARSSCRCSATWRAATR